MKKYTFILAIFATIALTACGSGSTTTETTDSTAVSVDTTAAVVDSTNVDTQTGGGSASDSQPVK